MLAVVALTVVQQFTSSTSSGVVLFYWLWEVVLNMSRVYGLALRNKLEDSDLVLYNVSLISQLILTVCILFAELYFPIVPKKFTPRKERISPFDTANVFSRISFSWMDKLMAKGYSNFLTEDDLPPLPHEIKSGVTSSGFNKYWNLQKARVISQHFSMLFPWHLVVKFL